MAKDTRPQQANPPQPASDPFSAKPAPSGNGISTAQLQAANEPKPETPAAPPPNPGRRPSNELSDVKTSISETGAAKPEPVAVVPAPAPIVAADTTQTPAVGPTSPAQAAPAAPPAKDPLTEPGRYIVEFAPETGVAHGYVELDAEGGKDAWQKYCRIVGISGSRVAPKIERMGDKTGEQNVLGPPVEPLRVTRRDPILAD